MASGKRRIGAELAMVALILASLAGTLHLVVSIHRKALTTRKVVAAAPAPAPTPPIVEAAPEPPKVVEAPPKPVEKPKPAPPPPPVEDPTPKALAQLAESTAREAEEAARLDREAARTEEARSSSVAEADRWKRREMLVQQQLASLAKQAEKLDREVDAYAAQRDVLARERDALKAALANAPGEGSYAVLPYRGENGTWRRPIVIECTAGEVSLRPDGPTFSMLDLTGLINPRSSPVVVAIARELLKVQNSASPDGSPVVPYFVFLVRPDGIRSYYEARGRLEPLGISFGYELIDKDLKVHVPNFDDLATWDGSPSTGIPRPKLAGDGGEGGGAAAVANGGLAWPGALAGAFEAGRGADRAGGTGAGPDGESPDDFVWPGSQPGLGRPGTPLEGGGGGEGEGPGGENSGPEKAELGSFGSRRGDLTIPRPRRMPGAGSPRGGLGGMTGLGSAVGSLPDFERPGGPPGSRFQDRSTSGPEAGTERRGDAASRPGPNNDDAPAPNGLAIPGRSWNSDGAAKPAAEAEGLTPAPLELRPAPSNSPGLAAAPEPGGLMWGGAGSPAGPRSTGDRDSSGGAQGPAGEGPPGGGSTTDMARTPPPGVDPRRVPPGAKPPANLPNLPKLAGLGLGLGAASGSSGGQPAPGLMLGAEPDRGPASDANAPKEPGTERLIPDPDEKRPPAIQVPFEIVVACREDGLTIQPGGYRITSGALRDRRDEALLVRNLAAVARRRAEVDPAIRPRPRIKFVVETDGASTFWEARRQILFSDLTWPMTLQVAGAQNPRFLEEGVWR